MAEETTKQEPEEVKTKITEDEEKPQKAVRGKTDRPVYKLSVRLIDTYKFINKVYYEAKAKRLKEQASVSREGVYNDGYDDSHYDYILRGDEIFFERYIIKHRVGKGSFGQVVCAYDQETQQEVAIKIIKSRKPFLVQAQTEIGLLTMMQEKKGEDNHIVKLLHKFVFRNHQCIVFEMLSYNLYDLLKNTRFKGVSLNLIRKFAKQILKALEFLASSDVDVIHCDLKPENILLRHPRRSAITIIDFGSSCLQSKKTYTYIQSRFYRSPEVLLGLPYSQKIDMWSLGCILVEMHTGEPLFGGCDQHDQICRIIDVLGMPPLWMIDRATSSSRDQFFEKMVSPAEVPPSARSTSPQLSSSSVVVSRNPSIDATHSSLSSTTLDSDSPPPSLSSSRYKVKKPEKTKSEVPPPRSLRQIIGVDTGGPYGRRKGELGHAVENYEEFLDFVRMMLVFDPNDRVTPTVALRHPYLAAGSSDSVSTASGLASQDGNAVTATTSAVATEEHAPTTGQQDSSNAAGAAAPAVSSKQDDADNGNDNESSSSSSSSNSQKKAAHKRAPLDPLGPLPRKYLSRSEYTPSGRVRSRSVPSSMRLRLRQASGDIEEEQEKFEDKPSGDGGNVETKMQVDNN